MNMRAAVNRVLIGAALCLFFSSWADPAVSAHGVGQEPFFTVDGAYPKLYFILNDLVTKLDIPETVSDQQLVAGEAINFGVNVQTVDIPRHLVDQTTFTMDFGDGTQEVGRDLAHTYAKPGSYIVKLYSELDGQKTQIESCLIHVLPWRGYVLPRAAIAFNGKLIHETDTTYGYAPGSAVRLDAGGSRIGSSPIVAYNWDLSDGAFSSSAKVRHTFSSSVLLAAPVVRIYDKHGLFSDAYVDLKADPSAPKPAPDKPSPIVGLMQGLKKQVTIANVFDGKRILSLAALLAPITGIVLPSTATTGLQQLLIAVSYYFT